MSRHFPFAGTFGAANDFFSNQLGGFFTNLFFAQQQQERNESTLEQQENLVGQAGGIIGLEDIPGIPSFDSPFDISGLPGEARGLANQLTTGPGSSRDNLALGRRELFGQFGPQSALQTSLGALPGQFGEANQGILSEFASGATGINQGFQDRLGGALSILEGSGRQAAEDISTRFETSLGNEQQALRARGFGGTQAANLGQASAIGESAEQRRLQEQLRQQRLGVFSDLSGQALGAQERLLGSGANLAQGGQQFLGGLNLNALGQQGALGQFFTQQLAAGRADDLANRFQFGRFPLDVTQQTAGLALSGLGPIDIRNPQQLNPALLQSPVR